MAESAALNSVDWPTPDALVDLIDELRANGYKLSLTHYIAAQDLLLALRGRAAGSVSAESLRQHLGPLVCSSPQEQVDFAHRYHEWRRRTSQSQIAPTIAEAEQGTKLAVRLRTIDHRSKVWLYGLVILSAASIVVVAIALASWVSFYATAKPASQDPISPATPAPRLPARPHDFSWHQAALAFALVPAVCWILWRALWAYRARSFFVRQATTTKPEIQAISVASVESGLFPPHDIFELARVFRQRVPIPSKELDIERTILRTAEAAEAFVPVFAERRATPEYVVLVDRCSPNDQLTCLYNEYLQRLEDQGVFIRRFYFDGTPRTLFPIGPAPTPTTLYELSCLYPGHRLLIFSDGLGYFNPVTGQPVAWSELFDTWSQRAWLLSEPVSSLGASARLLEKKFLVEQADLAGLVRTVMRFNSSSAEVADSATPPPPIPNELLTRPQGWLDRFPLPEETVDRMVDRLRLLLGNAGFYWLAACAIYPEVQWGLTLHFGSALVWDDGARLMDRASLGDLLRLPWFRHQYMPDWLRVRLLNELPRALEQKLRSLVDGLLLTAIPGAAASNILQIAHEHPATMARLRRPLLRLLGKKAEPDGPLKDYVFLRFMCRTNLERLAVRAPQQLVQVLRGGIFNTRELSRGAKWERYLLLVNVVAAGVGGLSLFQRSSTVFGGICIFSTVPLGLAISFLASWRRNGRALAVGLVDFLPLAQAFASNVANVAMSRRLLDGPQEDAIAGLFMMLVTVPLGLYALAPRRVRPDIGRQLPTADRGTSPAPGSVTNWERVPIVAAVVAGVASWLALVLGYGEHLSGNLGGFVLMIGLIVSVAGAWRHNWRTIAAGLVDCSIVLGLTFLYLGWQVTEKQVQLPGSIAGGLGLLVIFSVGVYALMPPRRDAKRKTTAAVPQTSSAKSQPHQEATPPRVFMAYRHLVRDVAGRVHGQLVRALGDEAVVRDVGSIPLGADFPSVLADAINRCSVMVAIIDGRWIDSLTTGSQPRQDKRTDWLRWEIELAMQSGKLVIPVLLETAQMPRASDLPPSLRKLAMLRAFRVRPGPEFQGDVQRLIASLTGVAPASSSAGASSKNAENADPGGAESQRDHETRAEQPLRKVAYLSHAAADAKSANELCRLLERQDIGCWIGPRDVHPGFSYSDQIVQAIEDVQTVVVLLSAAANATTHIEREIIVAFNAKKRVIPVLLEEHVQPGPSLMRLLATTQWIEGWRISLAELASHLAEALRDERWLPPASPGP